MSLTGMQGKYMGKYLTEQEQKIVIAQQLILGKLNSLKLAEAFDISLLLSTRSLKPKCKALFSSGR